MRSPLRQWRVLLFLALMPFGVVAAEPRILIVRDDTPVTHQTADLLTREFTRLGWSSTELIVGDRNVLDLRREGEQILLVALGSRALLAAKQAGQPTVGALIPRATLEELPPGGSERWTAIVLDQPLERWAGLIRLAFPDRQQVGLLVGPAGQKVVRPLERRLQEHRMTLATEAVVSQEMVVAGLDRLLPRMAVLLALPDSIVHNRNTVQPLLLTTYRAGIPIVAYSEAYLNAGAAVVLYSTAAQIAAQVVESVQQLLEGRSLANIQTPRYYTVGVNSAVVRSLDLSVPPANELQERLRGLDQ
jgi:putative tryptophan/tyrosine transport system substrate-binding protein